MRLQLHQILRSMQRYNPTSLQLHQLLPLPQKSDAATSPNIVPATKSDAPRYDRKHPLHCAADSSMIPSMIREWSVHEPVSPQPARSPRLCFTLGEAVLIQHFALRLSFQISPNIARATKSDSATSPNSAPATKSDTPSRILYPWQNYSLTELFLEWIV